MNVKGTMEPVFFVRMMLGEKAKKCCVLKIKRYSLPVTKSMVVHGWEYPSSEVHCQRPTAEPRFPRGVS